MPNTTNVEDREFLLFPEGWYTVTLHGYEEKTAKSGTAYVHLKFKHDTGQMLFGNLSYVESALWKVKQFKRAVGIPDEATDLDDYLNYELQIYVIQDEYEGKKNNKVTEYRKAGEITKWDKQVIDMLNDTPASEDDNVQPETDDALPF